jgi:hypothetical protein
VSCSLDPAEFYKSPGQRGSGRSGKMRPSLTPVETRARERAPRRSQRIYIDSEVSKPRYALLGQLEVIVGEC